MTTPRLSARQVVKGAIDLLFDHWKPIVGLAVVLGVPLSAVSEILSRSLGPDSGLEHWRIQARLNGLLDPFYFAAMIFAVNSRLEGREPGLFEACERGGRRWLPLVGQHILVNLIVLTGLICLVVPGVYGAVVMGLAGVILVVEQVGVTEAISRSTELARNQFWLFARVFGLCGLLVLLFIAGNFMLGTALALAGLSQVVLTSSAFSIVSALPARIGLSVWGLTSLALYRALVHPVEEEATLGLTPSQD